jgi:ACDE family multidrug resistance protein
VQEGGRRLVSASKSTIFATFFFLYGFGQTIAIAVLPIEALRIIGDTRDVSVVYFGVGVAGLVGRFAMPLLIRSLHRFGVAVFGIVILCLSALLLASVTVGGFIVGLVLFVFAFACVELVLNLYVLDHIPRSELGRFESKRIFFSAAPYTLGPWLGVYLQLHLAQWAPFAFSTLMGIGLLIGLRVYRFAEMKPRPSHAPALNPLRHLHRFIAQPRLRLAWALSAGRSAWWGMFQIYAPIFAVQSGLGDEAGGLIVSIGLASMWSVPLWGWTGRRFGLRRLLLVAYAGTGLLTMAAGLAMGMSWLGVAILVLAALAATTIDGAGNSLYLRAVHAHERNEMTAVFATYRDVAQLAPPAVFALLLAVFELPAIFLSGGAMMIGMAALTRYIPRRF